MKYPPIHYHDYLGLTQLLSCQKRKSEDYGHPAHDEWLFITVHQTYELWFQQILWELDASLAILKMNPLPDLKVGVLERHLNRVVSILRLILGQIDVLETMTPLDFLEFRDFLVPASGFQSFQFRMIETKLGLRTEQRLQFTQGPFYQFLKEDQKTRVQKALSEPTLFDNLENWLSRTPFMESQNFSFWQAYQKQVHEMIARDTEIIRNNPQLTDVDRNKSLASLKPIQEQFDALLDPEKYRKLQEQGLVRLNQKAFLAGLLIQLYRDEPVFQTPFRIISNLMDIDELMTQWRYRHSLMAHRMLGTKIGTGGTSGHQYLKDATEKHKIFTDFFNLSTFLIPKSLRPQLPEGIKQQMSFTYS